MNTETVIEMPTTWESTLPILLMAYENGQNEGRKVALEELQRLARVADKLIAEKKGAKK